MLFSINIEFIIAAIVFLSTICFVAISILSNVPYLHHESLVENIKSRIYQISNTLIFDKGLSTSGSDNWNRNNVARIGLSTGEPYVMDINKINELDSLCNVEGKYEQVDNMLTDYSTYIELNMSYMDGTQILDCRPVNKEGLEFTLKRFGTVGGNLVSFEITLIGI